MHWKSIYITGKVNTDKDSSLTCKWVSLRAELQCYWVLHICKLKIHQNHQRSQGVMRICLQTLAPNREIFKYFPLVSILTRLWVRMKGLQSVKMKRSNSAFSRDTEYLIKPWICSIFFFFFNFSSISLLPSVSYLPIHIYK